MMKFYCISFLCLISALNSFSQVTKFYVNANGEYTTIPKKAVAYTLVQKESDSLYITATYDLRDTIVSTLSFKDASLKIPNGKFIHYSKMRGAKHSDTNNYVNMVGYFTNGVKTGMWVEFEARNIKKCTYFYQDDKMNGPYRHYVGGTMEYLMEEGNYVNDKREGEWNVYGYDTLKTPVTAKIFSDDKVVKTINHIEWPVFARNTQFYLLKKLSKLDSLGNRRIETKITIGIDGNVKDPAMIKSISPQVDELVINTLKQMPKFTPEMHEGKPVEMRFILNLSHEKLSYDNYGTYALSLGRVIAGAAPMLNGL